MNSPAVKKLYLFFGQRFRTRRATALRQQFSECESVIDVGGSVGWWKDSTGNRSS